MRLRYLAAAPLVAVAMFGTTAAAWPSGTAAVPQAPPALTVSALSDGYTAEARAIKTAERAAIRHRDSQLASALARLAPRQVLFFNPNGQGVAAMVIGDLATATRVAILVPGSDTTLATFFSRGPASPGGGAEALAAQARRLEPSGPGGRLGGNGWLRYPPPGLLTPGVVGLRGPPGAWGCLVGVYAAARSYRGGSLPWLRKRMIRLARPVAALVAVWIPVTIGMILAGVPAATVHTIVFLVISPLWFLGVYAVLTALTPAAVGLVRRFGAWAAAFPAGVVAVIDLVRFGLHGAGWGGWGDVAAGL